MCSSSKEREHKEKEKEESKMMKGKGHCGWTPKGFLQMQAQTRDEQKIIGQEQQQSEPQTSLLK